MSNKKNPQFEDALKRLEELTDKLENESLPLDQALEVFKEAINLTKFCESKLKNISQEIIVIENSEYVEPETSTQQDQEPSPKKTKKKKVVINDDQDSLF